MPWKTSARAEVQVVKLELFRFSPHPQRTQELRKIGETRSRTSERASNSPEVADGLLGHGGEGWRANEVSSKTRIRSLWEGR